MRPLLSVRKNVKGLWNTSSTDPERTPKSGSHQTQVTRFASVTLAGYQAQSSLPISCGHQLSHSQILVGKVSGTQKLAAAQKGKVM